MKTLKKFENFHLNEGKQEEQRKKYEELFKTSKNKSLTLNDENFHKLWEFTKKNGGVMSIPKSKYTEILLDAGYEEKTVEDEEMVEDVENCNVVKYFFTPNATLDVFKTAEDIDDDDFEDVKKENQEDEEEEDQSDEYKIYKELEEESSSRETARQMRKHTNVKNWENFKETPKEEDEEEAPF